MTVVAIRSHTARSRPSAVAGAAAPAIPNKTIYGFTLTRRAQWRLQLVQQYSFFAPGSQTAKHHHGGPGVITVVQGEFR